MSFTSGNFSSLPTASTLATSKSTTYNSTASGLRSPEQTAILKNSRILTAKTSEVESIYGKVLVSDMEQLTPLLPIVKVRVETDSFICGQLYAMLDTGAEPNIITADAVKQLKIPMTTARHRMTGIDGRSVNAKGRIQIRIRPWFDSDEFLDEEFMVLPRDSCWNLVSTPVFVQFPSDSSMRLANPDINTPMRVHIILGVTTVAKSLISIVPRELSNVHMLETIFGVVIYGAIPDKKSTALIHTITEDTEFDQLDRAIAKLWQLDQIPDAPKQSNQERLAEQIFLENCYRDEDGRFNVAIPLKPDITGIGESRKIALQRFFALERKFDRDPELRQKYVDFMTEYIHLGHMRLVNKTAEPGDIVYHIPHHCVTRKFRVVFDGSCKTDQGISLNDIQLIGGKLQLDLADIIMRLRRHPTALIADICKMFRQVRVIPKYWNLQRIFWRADRNEPLQEYWLTVVTYGLASSAHNAVRALVQCGREAESEFPTASNMIMKDFYMDDFLSGAETESEAKYLAAQVTDILKNAGFELTKWQSNSALVRTALQTAEQESIFLAEEDSTSILGLKWSPSRDTFSYTVKMCDVKEKMTKRSVLSKIAQLYDPQGYIAPVTVVGRLIMQEIWKAKIDWDSELPVHIKEMWIEFWKDIRQLENFKIPRWLKTRRNSEIHLHGFADSSSKAYGATIYVQVRQSNDSYTTNLLLSKSRVAPLKTISIPRLELTAMELLSRLMTHLKQWNGEISRIHCGQTRRSHYIGFTRSLISAKRSWPTEWHQYRANRT